LRVSSQATSSPAAGTPASEGAALSNLTANATILRPDVSAGHRILVVDDEPNIVDVISMALRFHGFDVEAAGTGAAAIAAVGSFRPDLIVLDVMLPDMEGFDVARRLGAERARVPVIFLTARDATEDRVRGLTIGADDYVTKPFSLEELVARLRTVMRRAGVGATRTNGMRVADLVLDEDTREVRRGDRQIDLTPTEFELLRFLMRNARTVLSKAQILDRVWEYDFGGNVNIVELYISYLRRKVDVDAEPLIHTVRGVGYVLRAPLA
jgi:two-component system, OmpR family, response regulator